MNVSHTLFPSALLFAFLGFSTFSTAGEELRKVQKAAPEDWIIEVVKVESSTISSASTSPRLKVSEFTLHAVTAKIQAANRTASKVAPGDVVVIRITQQTTGEGADPKATTIGLKKGERHRAFLRRSEDARYPQSFVPAASSGSFQKP